MKINSIDMIPQNNSTNKQTNKQTKMLHSKDLLQAYQ